MKVKLYDNFNFWQASGSIWLIGDTHFDDEDCPLMNANWPSPEEAVNRINNCVFKNDTLIILGDVGNAEWVKKLKGHKVLIMGNHDSGKTNYKKIKQFIPINGDERFSELKEKYPDFKSKTYINGKPFAYCDNGLFDEVYEGPLFISPTILLSHEPVKLDFGLNIHGHVHNGEYIKQNENSTSINLCSDCIEFTPKRLDKIYLKTKNIHRITIDKIK